MAEKTKEVRTIMYSVTEAGVVTHHFPFNANEAYGRSKLQKFVNRGFTFDDPRLKTATGTPQVVVTQVVDLEKPIDGAAEVPTVNEAAALAQAVLVEPVKVAEPVTPEPPPVKKWVNMNAQERKEFQAKKVANA